VNALTETDCFRILRQQFALWLLTVKYPCNAPGSPYACVLQVKDKVWIAHGPTALDAMLHAIAQACPHVKIPLPPDARSAFQRGVDAAYDSPRPEATSKKLTPGQS
jgi:hypothetical protein